LSNEFHSDKYYDDGNTSTTFFPNLSAGLINGHHSYTGDFRGDVARILFYMAIRYDGLTLKDVLGDAENTAMGKLSTLLRWNAEDGVDDFERQRNNRIYSYQGNRNPFIDFPKLADAIW
jgi:endonuclease I